MIERFYDFTKVQHPNSEALCDISEQRWFSQCELIASRQTPKLEDHSWPTVHDCLFNMFAANLHIWRPTPPSATRGDAPCLGDRSPRMDH